MTMRAHRDPIEVRHNGAMSLAGPAWCIMAVAATLPIFWFGFEGLAQEWARPEFRFKAIVPFVSLILFLQVLRSIPPPSEQDRTRWLGVVGIGGAMLLALLGNLVQIDDIVFVAIILWVAGMIITGFGLRRGLAFWAPVASLFLMLPLPRFVVAPIHWLLEAVAAELGLGLLRLMQVPVHLEGQILDFGVHRLRVEEAMAGLVNFLPVMLAFFFFATVYRGPLWSRLMPLVLAAPVMVLLTSARIAGVGFAIDRSGSEAAEIVLRLTDDWVFFTISVAVILFLVIGSQRIVGQWQTPPGRLDFNLSSLGTQVGRFMTIRPTMALMTSAVMTAALSAAFALGPSRPNHAIEREAFHLFPPDVGGWHGTRSALELDIERTLNADDYLLIDFSHPDERAPVNFWSAYYYVQEGDKGGIHSPKDCLPGDGWNIVSFQPVEVRLETLNGKAVNMNRAVIRKGEINALVYYWFDGRGRRLSNERLARLLVKVDGLLRGRTDGALVRFATAILRDESEQQAEERLHRLMAPTVPHLHRFVPL
jgi:exosortase D (VPLPA-CTERM-specific)